MSKIFLLIVTILSYSACVMPALSEKLDTPSNVSEKDIVGEWNAPIKELNIVDYKEEKSVYEHTSFKIVLHPDHTYEEILLRDRERDGGHKSFKSKWDLSHDGAGGSYFHVQDFRYYPQDASGMLELAIYPSEPEKLLLCYSSDPDEIPFCFEKMPLK